MLEARLRTEKRAEAGSCMTTSLTFLYKPEEHVEVGDQVEDGEEGRGWLLYAQQS